MHPIQGNLSRVANADDIIPLSEPMLTTDGRTIDRIPIKKGQVIECSAFGYNRCAFVWICVYNEVKRMQKEPCDMGPGRRSLETRALGEEDRKLGQRAFRLFAYIR